MNKTKIISIICGVITIILTIIAYIILPDEVITQIGAFNNSTSKKLYAIAIPALIGIIGAVLAFFAKEEKKARSYIIVSIVGIGVFIIMFFTNL